MSYRVVFQNSHFIIVNKAPNVLSVPSRTGVLDTRICLGRLLEVDLQQKIYPIHRLDYEVQGLIMYALTSDAQKAGNSWFEKKEIQKTYWAMSCSSGIFKIDESLEWRCKLLRGKKRAYEAAHGKESLTRARLLFTTEAGYSYWELMPVTGRSHQLRYELFRHHETIVGDTLYGFQRENSKEYFSSEGIALQAFKIDFSQIKNRELFSLPETIFIEKFAK